MPRWFNYISLIDIIKTCSAGVIEDKVGFRCDESETLVRGLNAGTLDLAFICDIIKPKTPVIALWPEPMIWLKSPTLVLKPGAPLPLVSCPGTFSDRIATKLLEDANIRYEISFSGPEHASRKAAVAAGVGVMLMPERVMTRHMVAAREAHLPKPPTLTSGLLMREGLDVSEIKPLVDALETVLKPPSVRNVVEPFTAQGSGAAR
jgi:DNA-binding transcriptional LysR family regulator